MRTLMISVDDKTKAIGVGGNDQFTALELLGIAEHFKMIVEINHRAQIEMAVAQNLEKKIQVAQAVGVDKQWPRH